MEGKSLGFRDRTGSDWPCANQQVPTLQASVYSSIQYRLESHLFLPDFGTWFLLEILENFGMVPKKDNVISGCINRDIPSRKMAVTVLFNSALVRLF